MDGDGGKTLSQDQEAENRGASVKRRKWSRVKIKDEFADLKKRDGTPASRQQARMLRCRKQGLCLVCGKKARLRCPTCRKLAENGKRKCAICKGPLAALLYCDSHRKQANARSRERTARIRRERKG